jgi:hypothetical protein
MLSEDLTTISLFKKFKDFTLYNPLITKQILNNKKKIWYKKLNSSKVIRECHKILKRDGWTRYLIIRPSKDSSNNTLNSKQSNLFFNSRKVADNLSYTDKYGLFSSKVKYTDFGE